MTVFLDCHGLICNASRSRYVDATFHVVRPPFTQLFSVHGFVRAGGKLKQLPLVFVIMSGRRTADYAAVLRAVLAVLPAAPAVQRVVADFEAALWQAVRAVMPTVQIKGCLFHFTQVSNMSGHCAWKSAIIVKPLNTRLQ